MLTRLLEREFRKKQVTRVLVRAEENRLDELALSVGQLIPQVRDRFSSIFPAASKAGVLAMGRIKIIRKFNLLGFPATPNIIEDLAQDGRVDKVFLDREMVALSTVEDDGIFTHPATSDKRFTTTFFTKKLIGADRANEQGFTGRGIKVSINDTGGTPTHPQTRGMRMFTTIPGLLTDFNQHGGWCASCAFGSRFEDPILKVPMEGMAPDADRISIKCLGFVIGTGTEADILQSLEMASQMDAKIINLSLGSTVLPASAEEDPECLAIKILTDENRIVCVAAGNSGPGIGTVNSPGACPDSLTVGSLNPINGEISRFSSRGPVYGTTKPDIILPGQDIDSGLGVEGILDGLGDQIIQGASILSGTSMATPHGSGLLANMAQLYEQHGLLLNTKEVKNMMMTLGHAKNNDSGWGLLNWTKVEKWVQMKHGITVPEIARSMQPA